MQVAVGEGLGGHVGVGVAAGGGACARAGGAILKLNKAKRKQPSALNAHRSKVRRLDVLVLLCSGVDVGGSLA